MTIKFENLKKAAIKKITILIKNSINPQDFDIIHSEISKVLYFFYIIKDNTNLWR